MLYLRFVDLFKYETNEVCFYESIGQWIKLVMSRAPKAVILIVPTHLDLVEDPRVVHEKCEHIKQRSDHFLEELTEQLREQDITVEVKISNHLGFDEEVNDCLYHKKICSLFVG